MSPEPTPTLAPPPTSVPTARATTTSRPGASPVVEDGRLGFTSDLDTRYYPVFGTETSAIFASIEANGPTLGSEPDGAFSSGLTEYEGLLDYELEDSSGYCRIDSGSVTLSLVVTLPRHEQLGELASDLASRWSRFQQGVTEHEQRHVDIFLDAMRSARESIEALSGRFPGCAELERSVTDAWDRSFEANEARQEAFHQEEAERSRALRGPLQLAIAENQARVDTLDAQIGAWSRDSDRLGSSIDALVEAMRPYSERMDEIRERYPDLVLPQDLFEEYDGLYSTWSSLNEEHSDLVSDFNAIADLHNAATEEVNEIQSETNALIEEMNWLP